MPLSTFTPFERACLHPILCDKPALSFFEGALLGNGGLGAVVTTRPDAVAIHFGHNNVWDIRVAEDNKEQIGAFAEVFAKVKAIPADYATLDQDEWYRAYSRMTAENYAAPYPRPFPCGTLILGFDRREAELLGHRLDIATGLCEVSFLMADGRRGALQLFTAMDADRLWLRFVGADGRPAPSPFERVRLLPDPDTPRDFPAFAPAEDVAAHRLAFRQTLPALGERREKDRAFRLSVCASSALVNRNRINWSGVTEWMGSLERAIVERASFVACVQLDEGMASAVGGDAGDLPAPDHAAFESARDASRRVWVSYWDKSGVKLDDAFLERTWYHNLYFLNCATRAGVNCPGLWANWSYRGIGSAWHGDYHMNYNTQQPFWCAFSSNHLEKHLPYVDLVHFLLPISRKWAREYYGLRGAYFPHSAYPTEMTIMPYPVPTWGWEICETPWTVQSLWWHYLYTLDAAFLRERAFEPLKEATLFLVDYMRRPEAHGEQWGDDAYHIYPTAPPELYGLTPGLTKNFDCLVDLTLTKFVLKAFAQACDVLGGEIRDGEVELLTAIGDVLAHFPAYPTAEAAHGAVFVSVPGESAETVYNVPNPTMTVFPGEEHGLHSPPAEYAVAANSYRRQRIEGGNELVFLNLQGARLGLLDLERFKRQVQYCLLPNGACTDLALQVHGRYSDTTPYDFMVPMGIWFENFALPVVVNECLLQSYTGELRLFPNWPQGAGRAEFRTLRAVGGFLVSAACEDGAVEWIEVVSEAGAILKVINPWPGDVRCVAAAGERFLSGAVLWIETQPGQVIVLTPCREE
ncbi:MAG: glycoside hydrolase N-terminal domain-containing protein [Chloroflexi bacterium]|nr:glycoside hydrolase N-terminal domain-containing protein [Chloroflexota bacterium]MCL5274131.1 glycoside hydrolase N-terminal domain-containing protein [Chloroflexota bacterium]